MCTNTGTPQSSGFLPQGIEARVVDGLAAIPHPGEAQALVRRLAQPHRPRLHVLAQGAAQPLPVVGRLDALAGEAGQEDEPSGMSLGALRVLGPELLPRGPLRMREVRMPT